MSNSPRLQTKRLSLRRPVDEDIEFFYQLHSSPEVMRHIGNGEPQNRTTVMAYVKRLMDNLKKEDSLYNWWMAERLEDGVFVGWFVLKNLDQTAELELGYRLVEEYWGKGYATEGSQRVIAFAFEELQLERIVAITTAENTGSQRVIQKLGMTYRKDDFFYGKTCLYYDLTRDEYKKSE